MKTQEASSLNFVRIYFHFRFQLIQNPILLLLLYRFEFKKPKAQTKNVSYFHSLTMICDIFSNPSNI